MESKTKKPRLKTASSPARAPVTGAPKVSVDGWLAPFIVGAISFVAFLPALNNGFVNWDDDELLVQNSYFRGFGLENLRWMFTTVHLGPYQPLSWMTYALDYQIWGMDPLGFHLTNLILHAACGVLFFFLARRILTLADKPQANSNGSAALTFAAAFAALFFAIHPLRVESVAWATERRDVLSGCFFLACLHYYITAARESSPAGRRKALFATWMFYALSMLSKAAALTLPIVLLVLDVYPLRRLRPFEDGWLGPNNRQVWSEKIPIVLIAIGCGVVALIGQSLSGAMTELRELPWPSRFSQAFYGLAFYPWKTFMPVNLAPLYERPANFDPFAWPFLLSAVVVGAIFALTLMWRTRWPALLVAWLVYFLLILPFLGFAQSGTQLVADRYSYLSCLVWALLMGAGHLQLWRYIEAGRNQLKPIVAVASPLILLILAVLTWRQTNLWYDSETLWRHAVAVRPSATAHYNLAVALSAVGKIDEAKTHFQKTIEYEPRYRMAHTNLARLMEARGELASATEHLRVAVSLDPQDASAFNDLGLVLAKQNLLSEAVASLKQAEMLKPGDATTHFNLGNVLVKQGQIEEAVKQYQGAIRSSPDFAAAYHNLGRVLAAQGKLDEAIEKFRTAVGLRPDFGPAHESLKQALMEKKNS